MDGTGPATAFQGMLMMLSLIVAIGAQNTFLLRQGLRHAAVTPLVLICWLSDCALVLIGVSGLGAVVDRVPYAMTVIRIVGALVLLGYAALAIRRAVRGESLDLEGASGRRTTLSAIGTCLAITWLNPHVYLDTVLMVGAVANSHGSPGRWWFAVGTLIGSLGWFAALGYGARLLRPLFRKQRAWRILDSLIAAIMISTAAKLLLS
ncbi:LysE/ArgO family amino acid transporter [Microlunatus soli]|uniref:L-lysine exporter family protein LysE/ArgO n=1 Tax=Microlunatus soli TaxID=630515 RepID=A0A1H1TKA3_9ACTN|nr:LysE/ArgO family amino acid transporter [Microlunatus soli]SDS60622.1 L-lysine exporter family protein LysE/ArgO [Microlunatus soli]